MDQRVEGTYWCDIHGAFSLNLNDFDIPHSASCPKCGTPSFLTSVTTHGIVSRDEVGSIQEAIAKLQNLRTRRTPVPPTRPIKSQNGILDLSHIKISTIENAAKDLRAAFEEQEKAKMREVIQEFEKNFTE